MDKREQLLDIMEEAAKGETKATLRARIAELEAENARLQNEWDNCDEMLQATRASLAEALSRTGAVKVLEAELGWYSRTEHGALDGIPYKHVAHVIRVMLSRLSALEPAAPEEQAVTAAARDVLAERERQKAVEGWTVEHDDTHGNGEMARAAGIYALIAGSGPTTYRNAREGYTLNDTFQDVMEHCWPWNKDWFKPTDRRRDLVKAGALILAEIERRDRLTAALAQEKGR